MDRCGGAAAAFAGGGGTSGGGTSGTSTTTATSSSLQLTGTLIHNIAIEMKGPDWHASGTMNGTTTVTLRQPPYGYFRTWG